MAYEIIDPYQRSTRPVLEGELADLYDSGLLEEELGVSLEDLDLRNMASLGDAWRYDIYAYDTHPVRPDLEGWRASIHLDGKLAHFVDAATPTEAVNRAAAWIIEQEQLQTK